MAGDFQKPVVGDGYTNVLTYVRDMFADLAKFMDGTGTANTPSGAIRWNATTKRFEKYNGSTWAELVAKATDDYDISVTTLDGMVPGNSAGNIPVSNGTVNVNLNADMVDGAHAGTGAGNVLVLDGSALVPVANLPTITAAKGGTGQTGYAVGDLLYASSTSALAKRAAVATGSVLVSKGVATAPEWSNTPTISGITTFTAANSTGKYAIHLSNATPYISMWDTDGSRKWLMGSDADSFWVYRATTQSESATDWISKFKVDSAGNVLSSPSSVAGAFMCGSTTYPYLQNNGTDSVLAFDASDYIHYVKATNNFYFYIAGSQAMRIDGSRNMYGETLTLGRVASGMGGPYLNLVNDSGSIGSAGHVQFWDSGLLRNQINMYASAGGGGNFDFNVYYPGVGFANGLSVYNNLVCKMYSATFYKPGGGMFTDSSDERLKHNIVDYTLGLDAVLSLRTREFSFKAETGRDPTVRYVGLVAQEVQQTQFSERMLDTIEFKNERTGEVLLDDCLTLNASDLPYALVNAVKELSAKLDAANARIAALEAGN